MLAVGKRTDEPTGRPEESPFTRSVGFRITDPALWDGLQELIAEQEFPTTISDVLTIALRELLKRKGKYHPKKKPT